MSVQDRARGRDVTRARILETARELFGRSGFDNTTVREIAKQVGITDAALYYHFKSKREILTALWTIPVGGDAGAPASDASPAAELERIVSAALGFSAANDDILRIMFRETLGGDQTAAALRQQNRAFLRRGLQAHFGRILEPPEAELRAETVLAVLTGLTMRTQIESGQGYPALANSSAFRTQALRWVGTVARMDEAEAS